MCKETKAAVEPKQSVPALPEGHVLIDKSLLPLKYPASAGVGSDGGPRVDVPGYFTSPIWGMEWGGRSDGPTWSITNSTLQSGQIFAIPKDHELARLNGLWPDIDPGEGYEWVDRGLGWANKKALFIYFETKSKCWVHRRGLWDYPTEAAGSPDLRYFERVAKAVEPKATPTVWPPMTPPKGHEWVDRGRGWKTDKKVEYASIFIDSETGFPTADGRWLNLLGDLAKPPGGFSHRHYFELVPVIKPRPKSLKPNFNPPQGFLWNPEPKPAGWTNEGKPTTFAHWSAVTEEWTVHKDVVPNGNPAPSAYFEAEVAHPATVAWTTSGGTVKAPTPPFTLADKLTYAPPCPNPFHIGQLVRHDSRGLGRVSGLHGSETYVVFASERGAIDHVYTASGNLSPASWTPQPGDKVLIARASKTDPYVPAMAHTVGKSGTVDLVTKHFYPASRVTVDGTGDTFYYPHDSLLPIVETVERSETKFKVGQWVRATERIRGAVTADGRELVAGSIFKIARPFGSWGTAWYIKPLDPGLAAPDGADWAADDESLEPWTPKPGERVRIADSVDVAKNYSHGPIGWAGSAMTDLLGTIGTVTGFGASPHSTRLDNSWYWHVDDLEPVGPAEEEHPDTTPDFEHAKKVEDATRIWKLIKAVKEIPSQEWLDEALKFREEVIWPLGIEPKPQEIKLDIPQLKFEWVAKDNDGHWFAFANRPRPTSFGWTDDGDLSRIDDLFIQPFPEVEAMNSLFHFEGGVWKHAPSKL